MSYTDDRQAGATIEVTREMIEAGEAALDYARDAFSETETVAAVYTAMASARQQFPIPRHRSKTAPAPSQDREYMSPDTPWW